MAAYKGYNSTKITISLKKDERAALIETAESRNISVSTLCAEIIRKHIRIRYAVTDRETRTGKEADEEAKKESEEAEAEN